MVKRSAPGSSLAVRRERLEVPGSGRLRLAVVADTHGAPHPSSAKLLAEVAPDRILHAGDIGDLAVLDQLAAVAPVIAVRGNIDTRAAGLPDAIALEIGDARGTLAKLLLLHIAVYGPKLRADAAALARAEGASIVVCGHSHVPFFGRDKGILVVNPGSIGPRRFHLPIVFAVMDLSREGISLRHVSCETGGRWEPGAAPAA